MQRQMKSLQVRRRAPLQIDLFAEGAQKAIGDVPVWSALPTEIQAVHRLDNTVAPEARRQGPGWLDDGDRS